MSPDDMLAWQRHEETGEYPDDVLFPDAEDEGAPDRQEILNEVADQYKHDNEQRRRNKLAIENRVLKAALEQAGIDPDEVLHG